MVATDFEKIQDHVLEMLKGLDERLSYHCIDHTLDVVKQSTRIAMDEGVNAKELHLLRVAALYHDTGFLQTYNGHEEIGCEFFENDAERFGFHEADIRTIKALIMATKVPQQPKTLLHKIICDADLDYLGRKDFDEIAGRLQKEVLNYQIVKDEGEWHERQLTFLKNHHYHTNSSKLIREPLKKKNLQTIET